jgi:hypothetical protein
LVAELRAFANPILEEIAARPADYTDDFSNTRSDWPRGPFRSHLTGRVTGETGYVDGEYYLLDYGLGGEASCGVGTVPNPMPEFADFVFRIDVRFTQAVVGELQQDWQVFFRISEMGFYNVTATADGHMALRRYVQGTGTNVAVRTPDALRGIGETNTLQIVVRGTQMAVLLNGEPGIYGTDSTHTAGGFRLNACNNFPPNPLEVRWDNLAIWNLPN